MKKLTYIILAVVLFFTPMSFLSNVSANETKYGRILTDDVGLYTKSDGLDLAFFLPYTYYVKILEEGYPYSHIEIYGYGSKTTAIDGYALTEKLYFDGTLPTNPYPNFTLTTSCEVSTIFANKELSEISRRVFKGRILNYYGFNKDSVGNYIYFIEYNDCLGYISETEVMPFNFVLHPTPLPDINPPDSNNDKPPSTKPVGLNTAMKTIIIVCVCLAGLILLVVIFKPVHKKDKSSYYDENDYE